MVIDRPAGASSLQARRAAMLYEALRRLPQMPRTLRSFVMGAEFSLVPMPVMQIGVVGMGVGQGVMLVRMGMRLLAVPGEGMLVPVMLVVDMFVLVRQRLVDVRVTMPFADVQPDAEAHQRCRGPEAPARAIAEDEEGDGGAEEGRDREIGGGGRGAGVARRG